MKKTFCDICEVEITSDNSASAHSGLIAKVVKLGKPDLSVQVLVGNATDKLDGDFCKHCVIDAVNTLDDRPKERAACSA